MKIKNVVQKTQMVLALFMALSVFAVFSCKKKKTNEALYEASKAGDLSFYKGVDTIYAAAGGSPHGSFKLKFNAKAISMLDASGKLPIGGSFENGALIVKEVYSGNTLTLYAVMKKDASSKFSSNGWVWAEYEPDGKVYYSVSKNGKDCVSCHTSSPQRDYTRSFDLH